MRRMVVLFGGGIYHTLALLWISIFEILMILCSWGGGGGSGYGVYGGCVFFFILLIYKALSSYITKTSS